VHKYLLPGYIGALFRVVLAVGLGISQSGARFDEDIFTDRRSKNAPITRNQAARKADSVSHCNLFPQEVCVTGFDPLVSAALVPS